MKKCSRCKTEKPVGIFGKDKSRKDNLSVTCKPCVQEYTKTKKEENNKRSAEWYLKNKDLVSTKSKESYPKHKEKIKATSRKNHLLRNFKMSLEEYNKRLIQQDYKCKICNKPSIEEKSNLAVDHCHTTGVVRGLLCRACNTGIGKLKDSIEILKKAQLYIEKKGEI